MTIILPEALRQRAVASLVRRYDRRVMNNVHRGEYLECLVAELLGSGWRLPWTAGHDWAPWDLEHISGTRMEVKQSAALQSWHDGKSAFTSPRFDIPPRKGYWTLDGSWIGRPGRPADIYLFGWHPERDRSVADHLAPEQWRFCVVPASRLPAAQKSIGLAALERLVGATGYESLASAVAAAVDSPQTEGQAPAHGEPR
ncbi:MAG: hypothetical protein OYK82_08810 [Gammaproteobacteria bacterium]|nr:hypothetical protein [Gammaproteobacteria bacterium]